MWPTVLYWNTLLLVNFLCNYSGLVVCLYSIERGWYHNTWFVLSGRAAVTQAIKSPDSSSNLDMTQHQLRLSVFMSTFSERSRSFKRSPAYQTLLKGLNCFTPCRFAGSQIFRLRGCRYKPIFAYISALIQILIIQEISFRGSVLEASHPWPKAT